jgi:hypothetical protein
MRLLTDFAPDGADTILAEVAGDPEAQLSARERSGQYRTKMARRNKNTCTLDNFANHQITLWLYLYNNKDIQSHN